MHYPIILANEPTFRIANLTVIPAMRRIEFAGKSTLIAPRVMQVLVALYRQQDDVVGRDALNQLCWGGRHVGRDAVERVIADLRRIGEDSGGVFMIETIPRVGYGMRLAKTDAPTDEPARAAGPAAHGHLIGRRRLILGGGLALGLLGSGAVIWRIVEERRRDRVSDGPVRIAVLPFENLTADRDAGLLAAGMAHEVRDLLSRMAGLRVIAGPSSEAIGDAGLSGRESGSRLDVAYLVRGSVREQNGRLRVIMELIDAQGGDIIWSAVQDGSSEDPFAVQEAASNAVLAELAGRVGPTGGGTPSPPRRQNAQAYRLVVEAHERLEQSRTSRMRGDEAGGLSSGAKSEALARQALVIDADDPGALLVMAELTRNGWTRALSPVSAEQRVTASIAYVMRALRTDPNNAGALTALGDYNRRFLWRWDEAETLLRKALTINPSLVEAHWSYCYLLGVTGRALEGLAHAQILFNLDPETTWRRVALPRLLFLVGENTRAMARYDIELRTTPTNVFLILEIYLVLLTTRDATGLRNLGRKVLALQPTQPISGALADMVARIDAAAAALEGRPAALVAMIDADVLRFDTPLGAGSRHGRLSIDYLYIYAVEYAWAAQPDRSIALLERALAARSLYWPATLPNGVTPFPAETREHPRFKALWNATPERRDLIARRTRSMNAGQMAAVHTDGTRAAVDPGAIRLSLSAR